jgi:Xaa-Pro aminopeptidase
VTDAIAHIKQRGGVGLKNGSLMTIIDRLDFTKPEVESRISKVRRATQAAKIDMFICPDPSNMAWRAGYEGWSFCAHQAVSVGINPCAGVVWRGAGRPRRPAHSLHARL